jgi:hypothetical protein
VPEPSGASTPPVPAAPTPPCGGAHTCVPAGAGDGSGATPGGSAAAPERSGEDGTGGSGGPGPWRHRSARLLRWLRSPDGRAVSVLVLVPVALLALPAALGSPAVTGDNLIQNFPLRVLSGEQMRQGHLPLWNPYVWGGSPLLGGLNAGSFYPFTFFFVFLAPVAAWVVNLLGVYWAGGLGLYALARQYRLRPTAALLGALTYSLSGTMVGQLVHLGVVQGMGWAPLLVLAEVRLSWAALGTGPVKSGPCAPPDQPGESMGGAAAARPAAGTVEPPARSVTAPAAGVAARSAPWAWVALLALVVGLEALTGEPRSMAETEVLGTAVALWLLLRPYAGQVHLAQRMRMLGLAVLGGLWGVVLAGAELVPGWSFIEASQRATESYTFFGSGSLRVPWTFLLLVPDLLGGSGHFGQPIYFDRYNLPEVTAYVGLLPLAAALVLASRSFGRRRSRMAGDWGMWLGLFGLGLVLSWGSYTPLGHVWAAIPLFGKTRLQSRNLEIVDLALAVLLSFWVDRLLSGPRAAGTVGWRRLLAVAPAVGAAGICAAALIAPAQVEGWFNVTLRGSMYARRLWPWFMGEALIAAAVVALVLWWGRLSRTAGRRALTAVVLLDVALFLLAVSTVTVPTTVVLEPTRQPAAVVLGTGGRFALVDSQVSHTNTLSRVGQPDLNAFTRLASVQGYGSIVSAGYADATGTHTLDTLSACDLADGVFTQLRLSTLLAFPANLAPGVGRTGKAPPPRPACPGAPLPGTAHRRLLYLGWPTTLTEATLVASGEVPGTATPAVGVLGPHGAIRWPATVVRRDAGGWSVRFARPQLAAGIVVDGPARSISDTSTVGGIDGRWAFDGAFQDAVGTQGWRFTGTWDGVFARFVRVHVRGPVWLASPSPGSSVREVEATDWGSAVDRVVATRPVTVVWSESFLPGWHAELAPAAAGGRPGRPSGPERLTVERHGLVQSVRVPRGRWVLTFVYRAPHLSLGIAGSLVGAAGFVALGVATAFGRRRRRRRPVPGGPAGEPVA